MILPDKYVHLGDSLLGAGFVVLKFIREPLSLSQLWKKVCHHENIQNFNRFILTLDFLYTVEIITIENGFLKRRRKK